MNLTRIGMLRIEAQERHKPFKKAGLKVIWPVEEELARCLAKEVQQNIDEEILQDMLRMMKNG